MRIRAVLVNNRKARIELVVRSGQIYPVPFAKLVPRPSCKDRIEHAYVD